MATEKQTHDIIITPPSRWKAIDFGEIFAYRDLAYFFLLRNVVIRYKQTILGVFWVVIPPVVSMVLYTLIFGELANIPSEDIPYPLFSFSALVIWFFFSSGLGRVTSSLTENAAMITKVYFPRIILPLVSLLSGLIDFTLSFIILIFMMIGWGYAPTANIVFLPFFLLLAAITALGFGLWFAALEVQFRDVRYFSGYLLRFWLYATPITYPRSLLSDELQFIMGLQPLTGVVEGFRWALLGADTPPDMTLIPATIIAIVVLWTGAIFFQQQEKKFADMV